MHATEPRVGIASAPGRRRPGVVGRDQEVPLVTGSSRRYINLDDAASAPPLVDVAQAVDAFLPWYSSVHRGAGFKSRVSTAAYEGARDALRSFLGARPDDAVIVTRNTTDAANLLASSLPPRARVVAFASEHHANLLAWQRRPVTYLPIPESPGAALAQLDHALRGRGGREVLVAVTGASNVTGEIWPVREIAEVAHRHGARVFVDAAQLAPHGPIDMTALDVDYLALSGHKMYAPYGAGALLGRPDWLARGAPFLRGGGAVTFVTLDEVVWAELPDRQEAGSPNVLGAVALGVACRTLAAYGMDALAEDERALQTYARTRLSAVPGLDLYALWDATCPRVGILTFNLRGYHHSKLAAILSAEYGVGVRHGCFCAHPLLLHLLRVGGDQAGDLRAALRRGEHPPLPGAVRISLGLDTTRADIDAATAALTAIAEDGPRWRYRARADADEYEPTPDTRPWPLLAVPLAGDNGRWHGQGAGAGDSAPAAAADAAGDAPPDYIKGVPAWEDDGADRRDRGEDAVADRQAAATSSGAVRMVGDEVTGADILT